ncbi:glycosyltransferase [Rhizobium sp. L1K21]|uniref:CgeB family protein n=1 Tax=Rhizobium sp. L1K21 TaxID=2954933 RepID=UPI002092B65E|nr:glycosyltransferase [Rhizobium sp. L1K21]MCO6187814.1 glycosyltransferase [Rhizobium sp. L1K21]
MERRKYIFLGLSLSSAWGNGHATTFRALIKGLNALGHECIFLERNQPWFVQNRDMPNPDFCKLITYDEVEELIRSHARLLRSADAVIIGSYVPDGVAVIAAVAALRPNVLCFYDIDTPVTLGRLDKGDSEYITAGQLQVFDIYFTFSGGKNLTRLKELGARKAVPLYCSVDPELYCNTNEPLRWDLGYLGTYSDDRQPMLEKLLVEPARQLPEMRFVIAGAQYPDGLDLPANIERIEHVPPNEHASFYSRQRFTLNITRRDMVRAGFSPSVRLFEAAACKTPIISDDWEGLNDFLPEDRAIVIAEDSQQVINALTAMNDEERKALSTAAHRIVMGGHTGAARAEHFVHAIEDELNTEEEGANSWLLRKLPG